MINSDIKLNTLKIQRLQTNYDEIIDTCRESIREQDSLYTDKKRLESELISLRADYNDLTAQYTENSHDKQRLESEVDRLKTTLQETDNTKRERDSVLNKLYLSEKRLTDFVGDERTRDKLIGKYRELLREHDALLTDKERLESETDRLKKAPEERKKGFGTQKLTITKERLEYILNQHYKFEALKIDKILVGTQPPTLYPGSPELELDIQYTKDEEE